MALEINPEDLANWPMDASPMTNDQVTEQTKIMSANQESNGRLSYVTVEQVAVKAAERVEYTGIEMEPLEGGDTEETALQVDPGPSGEQRTAEVAGGKYYDFGSGAVLATADKRWKAYWNGSSWTLKDMGTLPNNASKATPWIPGTYDANTIVSYNDKEWISKVTTNQEPSELSTDWKVFGESENKFISQAAIDDSTHLMVDGNESITHAFKKDGDIASAVFPEGIKPEIEGIKGGVSGLKNILQLFQTDGAEILTDSDYNILRFTNERGEVFIPGLDGSIQDEFNKLKEGGSKSYPVNSIVDISEHNELTPEGNRIINRRIVNGLTNFAVPHGVMPQNWDFPINEIQTISAPLASVHVPIEMMNGGTLNQDSGVVHPNVVHFDFPVNGYRYWMTLNGYPNEAWEITWLYGTNNDDLTGWELISGVPQPFEDNPPLVPPYISSHDSDSFITYDVLRGEILIVWRRTMRWHPTDADKQTNEYRYRSSNNGTTWSEVKQFINPNTSNLDLMQSASVIYNPSDRLYYYFDVYNTISPGWIIKVRTNKDIQDVNGWSEYSFISTPSGVVPWHLEVKWIGDAVVLLLHQNQLNSPGNDKLWFAASKDMANWTWSENDVFGGTTPLYKSSFLPVYGNNGTMKFKIIYTTDENAQTGDQWKLKVTETNNFNI